MSLNLKKANIMLEKQTNQILELNLILILKVPNGLKYIGQFLEGNLEGFLDKKLLPLGIIFLALFQINKFLFTISLDQKKFFFLKLICLDSFYYFSI